MIRLAERRCTVSSLRVLESVCDGTSSDLDWTSSEELCFIALCCTYCMFENNTCMPIWWVVTVIVWHLALS